LNRILGESKKKKVILGKKERENKTRKEAEKAGGQKKRMTRGCLLCLVWTRGEDINLLKESRKRRRRPPISVSWEGLKISSLQKCSEKRREERGEGVASQAESQKGERKEGISPKFSIGNK